MKATICDVCKNPIAEAARKFTVTIHEVSVEADHCDDMVLDMCADCYFNPVILAEMRRTRTHRKAKVGRPRKPKTTPAPAITEG